MLSSMPIFLTPYIHQFLPFIRIALHNLKSIQGALADAGPAAIAIFFRDKVQSIINNSERTFHAVPYTFPAAITYCFIDTNDFSLNFHGYQLSRHYTGKT
jgi:hypothetical protein